jgi:hypothetical protein
LPVVLLRTVHLVDIWVSTASNVEAPSKYAPLLSIGSKRAIGRKRLMEANRLP